MPAGSESVVQGDARSLRGGPHRSGVAMEIPHRRLIYIMAEFGASDVACRHITARPAPGEAGALPAQRIEVTDMHDLLWQQMFWDWSSMALAATTLAGVWWLMVVEAKRRAPQCDDIRNHDPS